MVRRAGIEGMSGSLDGARAPAAGAGGGFHVSSSTKRRIDRREFMLGASALTAATLLGIPSRAAAEPPPEVTKIRLVKIPAICLAPEYLAEELLRLEGFTDIEYVESDRSITHELITRNLADMTATAPPELLPALDAGAEIVCLAGVHGGCYELFVHEHVRAIRDLKGKRIAVSAIGSLEYYFLASMMAYVGLDPRKDIVWVDSKSFDGMRRDFIEGRVDAFLAFPPQPQDLREREDRAGHRQHRAGSSVGTVLLLHDRRATRVREPVSDRHQARRACDPQGRRHLCARPRASRADTSSPKATSRSYEIALEVAEVAFLYALAYPQSGGLVALLWSAAARRGA